MKLKKLDKYIIGKFMGSFFVALALLTLIVIIFDVSEKIDDFVQKERKRPSRPSSWTIT